MTTLQQTAEQVQYTGNGTAGRESDVRPTGFLIKHNDKVSGDGTAYKREYVDSTSQREWVGLTDEERYLGDARSEEEIEYARAIEAKLKEKNT
jgi:hypothetical protein